MAEPSGITVEFPEKDLREFQRMMKMFEERLGKSSGDAVRWGMFNAAQKAASSTKKAPKERKLLQNKGKNAEFPEGEYPWYVKYWYKADKPTKIYVKRKNAKERRISHSGLAKNAWSWGLSKIGMRGPKRSGYSKASSVAVQDRHKDIRDPYIQMTSELDYASAALRGGKKSIDTAMRRASNSMRKYMERRLKETIKERNL